MYQKGQIKNVFSSLTAVIKIWLIGWRKHLTTSQATPNCSFDPFTSVVLTLQIPQRSEMDPSAKLYGKREQTPSK